MYSTFVELSTSSKGVVMVHIKNKIWFIVAVIIFLIGLILYAMNRIYVGVALCLSAWVVVVIIVEWHIRQQKSGIRQNAEIEVNPEVLVAEEDDVMLFWHQDFFGNQIKVTTDVEHKQIYRTTDQ
jgi:hypothetical protein